MPSIDVLLENAELTVLGPPTLLEVQLDRGATGQRGSQIYVGSGLPSAVTIANYSSILPGDLYINANPGANYSWLYQYLIKPAGATWEPILRLNPVIYNALYQVEFVSGEAEIAIPISNITTSTSSFSADNFMVNFSFEHNNPVAASISTKTIVGSNLVIDFSAAEYASSTWTPLTVDPVKLAITVSIITGSTVV